MPKQILWFVVFLVVTFAQGAVYAQPLMQNTGPGFAGSMLASPKTTVANPPSNAARWPIFDSPKNVILLNNGQVIHGEIITGGDMLQVRTELGVIPIPRADIAFVAATLRELHQFQKANVSKTSYGFLQLAEWCVANKLVDEATAEFDQAILLANSQQLADTIRNRKNAALTMFGERQLQTQMTDMENQKYRQWKQKIPQATFATFKREILPMLVQNCSGIACHSGNSLNEFRLVANPYNHDVDVAKNLQVVLGYITPDMTEESLLVLVPIAPHGRTKQIFTRRNFPLYEKLYFWADQVASEMDAYYPLDESDRVAATSGRRVSPSVSPHDPNNNMTLQSASSGNIPFPATGEVLMDTLRQDTPSAPDQASSLMQGLTQNSGSAVSSSHPSTDFSFFMQPSIVPYRTAGGGWPPSASTRIGQSSKTTILTHNSTDAFEMDNTLQQLQRDPVDPFDPVLFNRQYHSQRLKDGAKQ